MIFRIFSALILTFVYSTNHVFAVFDASLIAGKKTTKFDSKNDFTDVEEMGGTSVLGTVHWHPFSVLPMGFGVFLGFEKSAGESESYDVELDNQVSGLDVSVWGPFGMFKPFLSFGYLLMSSSTSETKIKDSVPVLGGYTEASDGGKLSGYRINAGLEWSVAPMISVILHYTKENETLTYNKIKGMTAAGEPFNISVDEVKTSVSGSVMGLGVGVRF